MFQNVKESDKRLFRTNAFVVLIISNPFYGTFCPNVVENSRWIVPSFDLGLILQLLVSEK